MIAAHPSSNTATSAETRMRYHHGSGQQPIALMQPYQTIGLYLHQTSHGHGRDILTCCFFDRVNIFTVRSRTRLLYVTEGRCSVTHPCFGESHADLTRTALVCVQPASVGSLTHHPAMPPPPPQHATTTDADRTSGPAPVGTPLYIGGKRLKLSFS